MKRIFIAIPVEATPSLRNLILELREQFRGESFSWVDPAAFHLTLRFLGDTPAEKVHMLSEAMRLVCQEVGTVEGVIKGLDFFSFRGTPSVLFARIEGWHEIPRLADRLNHELSGMGFPPGDHPFKAHLTLARMKNLRDKKRFKEVIAHYREEELQPAVASRVVLYESILRPQGPIYKPLAVTPLKMGD